MGTQGRRVVRVVKCPRQRKGQGEIHQPLPRGTVFASFSFSDVPVNILTGSGYDPITETAELKVCPVRVEPVDEPRLGT